MFTQELAAAKHRKCLLTCVAVCLGTLFAWACFAQPSLLCTAKASDPANTSEAEITRLQDEINKLQAEVNLLKRENEHLRKELDDARKDKAAAAPSDALKQPSPQPAAAPTYKYLGQPITPQRFAELYTKFGKNMIYVDGKLIDPGERLAWAQLPAGKDNGNNQVGPVCAVVPPLGYLRAPSGTVSKVEGDALIVQTRGYGLAIHGGAVVPEDSVRYRIRGVDRSKYAEGSMVETMKDRLVFIGMADIEGRTIQDYMISPPAPTEAQFAEALDKGLQLNRWAIVKKEDKLSAVATPVK